MDGTFVEAIREIVEAKMWAEKRIIVDDLEPEDVYFIVEPDGTLVRHIAEALDPEIECYSTEALLALADTEAGEDGNSVSLYYSAARAVAVVRFDIDRLRRHTLPLPLHPVFSKLEAHKETKRYTQRELIRLFRAQFNAYVPETTIEQFRQLKLRTDGEGESVVRQGHEGLSRSVRQQIEAQNGSAIPDEVAFDVPVFDLDEMRDEHFSVRVLVDCQPNDQGVPMFELTTVYSDLQKARTQALEVIAERLRAGEHDVYYGKPV